MELKKFKNIYILADMSAAFISWILFDIYRSFFIAPGISDFPTPFHIELKFVFHIITILLFWLVLYYSTGYYNNVLRKLRLEDFSKTFIVSFIGIFILFFLFFRDNNVNLYKRYYEPFIILFVFHFHLTLIPRLIITSSIIKRERKGTIKFDTIFIGRVERIRQVWKDLNSRYPGHGHNFLGYITVNESQADLTDLGIKKLGKMSDIHDMVKQIQPDDIIIALDETDADYYRTIIFDLNSSDVAVKVNPELYSIVQRQAIISSLFKYPLLEISRDLLKPWQAILKQLIDILGALIGLIITLPLCIMLMAAIKLTSKGPIFYSHERIGRFGIPFRIWKFRSMYDNAEANGPQLATSVDSRITPIGWFMRRCKFDEIPNFINVLKGEMSLVGPRPERKFYIDQITKRAPEYTRLLKVKPGVTSWGQVKYGYAENVDEMIRRMRYDLLYIDNMSLYVDFQILARTIIIIFRGRVK
jgi:exopolysaccharide biosynthesis polyprenyl glycosylphosphotransferase